MSDTAEKVLGVATRAERLGFVVDAAAYFDAFATAAAAASHSVLILGWEIDSGIALRRGPAGFEDRFGAYLSQLLEARPELEIHVLAWDWSLIYTLERELWPRRRMGEETHSRLYFELDDRHPVGASHHEKVVVVDDRVAFIGGIDFGRRRWDSRRHRVDEPGRRSPDGDDYRPFHDVQAVVSGDAAKVLGDRARQRWQAATGQRLPPPPGSDHDPWPAQVEPLVRDAPLTVIRTEPRHDRFETEGWHRRALTAARSFIYLENQYFTSQTAGELLADALRREPGPEVVLVTSRRSEGWLEQATMDARRHQLLTRLREADASGKRLRAWWPDIGDGTSPTVHTKLTVVDDRLAYLGSANLSNRSMGLDTECGIVLDANDDPRLEGVIASLRQSLLAEHLGVAAAAVVEAESRHDSLVAALESLRDGERTLRAVADDPPLPEWMLDTVLSLADPEHPSGPAAALLSPDRSQDGGEDGRG